MESKGDASELTPSKISEPSSAPGSNASSPSPSKTQKPLVQRAVRKVTSTSLICEHERPLESVAMSL
jgi:hypothetical protein